jgi:hypothetical protein
MRDPSIKLLEVLVAGIAEVFPFINTFRSRSGGTVSVTPYLPGESNS